MFACVCICLRMFQWRGLSFYTVCPWVVLSLCNLHGKISPRTSKISRDNCLPGGPFENPVRRWVRLREKAAFSVNGLKHFKNHVTSFFSFKEHVAHEFEPFESKPKAPLGQILHLAPPMAVCHFHVIFMWCPGESICQTHALGRVGTHVATLPRRQARQFAELPPPRKVPVPKPARRPFLQAPLEIPWWQMTDAHEDGKKV